MQQVKAVPSKVDKAWAWLFIAALPVGLVLLAIAVVGDYGLALPGFCLTLGSSFPELLRPIRLPHRLFLLMTWLRLVGVILFLLALAPWREADPAWYFIAVWLLVMAVPFAIVVAVALKHIRQRT
jgi:hypothetical protein